MKSLVIVIIKYMEFIIGFIVFLILIIFTIFINKIYGRPYIDLFGENVKEKLSNYKLLEIKRKRRAIGLRGQNTSLPYRECSLEIEYPTPWSIIPAEDIIEVYGIENNNKYLIYKIEWSKDNAIRIKKVVAEFNKILDNKK
jgi:hypothetical protein